MSQSTNDCRKPTVRMKCVGMWVSKMSTDRGSEIDDADGPCNLHRQRNKTRKFQYVLPFPSLYQPQCGAVFDANFTDFEEIFKHI